MKTFRFSLFALFTILVFPLFLNAQQPAPSATATVVPRLVNFSGTAVNAQGKPLSGTAGITFSIYKDQTDGAPLWMETQNVQADSKGNYSIQLGATKSDGLPMELFASGEARWLGVRVNGGEEQPRVMLLSVPYALKAGDAATVGGLPPSAFMLAGSTTEWRGRDERRCRDFKPCAGYASARVDCDHERRDRECSTALDDGDQRSKLGDHANGKRSHGQDRHQHYRSHNRSGCPRWKRDPRNIRVAGDGSGHGNGGKDLATGTVRRVIVQQRDEHAGESNISVAGDAGEQQHPQPRSNTKPALWTRHDDADADRLAHWPEGHHRLCPRADISRRFKRDRHQRRPQRPGVGLHDRQFADNHKRNDRVELERRPHQRRHGKRNREARCQRQASVQERSAPALECRAFRPALRSTVRPRAAGEGRTASMAWRTALAQGLQASATTTTEWEYGASRRAGVCTARATPDKTAPAVAGSRLWFWSTAWGEQLFPALTPLCPGQTRRLRPAGSYSPREALVITPSTSDFR